MLAFHLKQQFAAPKTTPAFYMRVYRKRIVDRPYEKEKVEYNRKMVEYRRKHFDDYWNTQTQIENDFLEENRQRVMAGQRKFYDDWRTSICKISLHTKKHIVTHSLGITECRNFNRKRRRGGF